MVRLQLRYGPRRGWVYLRDLRGDDEESIAGTDTWSAIALIDRLLVAVPGAAVAPGEAVALGAADRDRLLAAILRRTLGERIAATIECTACTTRFDLDFVLRELVDDVDAESRPADGDGTIAVGAARIRVPSGEDELAAAVAEDPTRELAARCVIAGEPDEAALASALEHGAPILDLELEAHCPECAAVTMVRFNIQHYLLGALLGEDRKRAGEVHRIARGYGWSLAEILSLPRKRRRDYVELVDRGGA